MVSTRFYALVKDLYPPIAEDDGTLGSICIYQATDPEAIRKHAHRVGMLAEEILDVADLVVIRPDPVQEASAS